jgi:mannose/cellobiose epimerase-like protein (N-acyl-D-glucosamine 2-epimerase family)
MKHTPDTVNGGFVGRVGHDGRRVKYADKGVVLNCRILWFFSEIARADGRPGYRETASRAFAYLLEHFDDRQAGGVVWKLSADGRVSDGKKQVYAQAFCIYAVSGSPWTRRWSISNCWRRTPATGATTATSTRSPGSGSRWTTCAWTAPT